ncbi:MAG: hypothetical protein HZC51_00945 [Nitrospirae bacterium]|nr:hypothetical protein [Nitrospirota bacterium]
MPHQIDELIQRMRELEEELEAEFEKRRAEFQFIIEARRVRFAEDVAKRHKEFKRGVLRYIAESSLPNLLVLPVIYTGFIPFALLDLFLFVFQSVCFPVYRIPKVNRSEYLVFDREELPYLNAIERFNCFYCAYANGMASYAREVAARTEQYWCPIKHARRIIAAHERYPRFFEFGDAESYAKGLEKLRKEYEVLEAGIEAAKGDKGGGGKA